jgi:hypothetical protein
MRRVFDTDIGPALHAMIAEPDPEDEDIGIGDQNGTVLAVVIPPNAYDFFLKAVERAEDAADLATVAAWRKERAAMGDGAAADPA